jgi:hypothetical protein
MTAPADPVQLDLALDRWPRSATAAPLAPLTSTFRPRRCTPGSPTATIDGSAAAEDPAHHPMLFSGVSLVRGQRVLADSR